MNIKQIEYFITICETMNFTKAAKKLYISQTAVTKQIQLLEYDLNTKLFNRDNKQIELTPAGQYFLFEAKKVIQQFNQSKLNIGAFLKGQKGTIRIGFLKNLDPHLLVKIFSSFMQEYPFLEVKLTSYANYQLYQGLDMGHIDIALGFSSLEYPNYQKIFIKKYPLVVVMNKNHTLAQQSSITEDRLTNILFDVRKTYLHTDYPEFEGNLLKIACNQGCAILHAFTKENCYNEYLKAIPLTPLNEKSIYLIYDLDNHNPLIDNLINYLKKTSLII